MAGLGGSWCVGIRLNLGGPELMMAHRPGLLPPLTVECFWSGAWTGPASFLREWIVALPLSCFLSSRACRPIGPATPLPVHGDIYEKEGQGVKLVLSKFSCRRRWGKVGWIGQQAFESWLSDIFLANKGDAIGHLHILQLFLSQATLAFPIDIINPISPSDLNKLVCLHRSPGSLIFNTFLYFKLSEH